MSESVIRGRGASHNPKNRFETLELTLDPSDRDANEGVPGRHTVFYKDITKTVLARNNSPDIGYDVSLNPYRGCEHGCVYCLSGDTLILMGDGTAKPLSKVCIGDTVYGTVRRGPYRRYVKTRVLNHWRTVRSAYKVTLEDGTSLVSSGDHRFLTERGWKFVTGVSEGKMRSYLTPNNKLMGVGAFTEPPAVTQDYKKGYLCGLTRGDGHLASYAYERAGRAHGDQHKFRLALKDREALERGAAFLRDFGVSTSCFLFQRETAKRKAMYAIRTSAHAQVNRIGELVAWEIAPSEDWCRGFLAGIFDAEGSYSSGVLRISNSDSTSIEAITRCFEKFSFNVALEHIAKPRGKALQVVRLLGGLREHLRFFHATGPAITRKRNIEGQAVKGRAKLRVVSIRKLGFEMPLFDITTQTGDFIANGVVSHNCYARPTHEYLGFSLGLDFETKIMVKEDAPELLRRELASPRWRPQVVGMGGVTDIYQPVERKLGLTRRCLEVFLDFRNPVTLVTKSHLITRDVDLLGELNAFRAVSVAVSLTTLDDDLWRVMEPRAASPARRLEAVRTLAAAGIRVGVLTSPIIPGLNDVEIPKLVAAASEAGAQFAGYGLVHLPYGLKELFADWTKATFPERADKILNRIREMRGGKLNDPRFGHRMRGEGPFADSVADLHRLACRRAGLPKARFQLSTEHFRVPLGKVQQPGLFE